MSAGIPLRLENLSRETQLIILYQGDLPISALRHLRETSQNLKSVVDEFVRHELIRLKNQGPSFIRDFLATQESVTKESVTSDNAWKILGLFKQTYPSLTLTMSIEEACQQLLDQATLELKNELVLQDAGAFADLALQQTAEQIRTWFSNPINNPLLQNVTGLNLCRKGLSLIPSELRFLSNLQLLDLSENNIKSIDPETFANLQNLELLQLDQNQIISIDPQTFANLSNLLQLNLNQNQLTALDPQTFAKLTNLRSLSLDQNQLTAIDPGTFSNLQDLRELDLQMNPMTAAGPIDRASLGLAEGVRVNL